MLGFVTGLVAEARLLHGIDGLIGVAGGTTSGVADVAESLIARGATVLISFGLAGGLDPVCRPGDLIVPAEIVDGSAAFPCDTRLLDTLGGATVSRLTGADRAVTTRTAKAALFAESRAAAVDLESLAVAQIARRHGIGFAALRSIVDPADRDLPHASIVALYPDGRISLNRLLASLLHDPMQVGGLIALGRGAAAARRTLKREVNRRFRV